MEGGGRGGIFQGDTFHLLSSRWPLTTSSKALNVYHLAGSVYSSPTLCFGERDSFVCTLWNEPQSEEPTGWYLAKVTYMSEDANAVIRYKRGSHEEAVNLLNVSLVQAKGNGELFFPISSTPLAVGAYTQKSQKSSLQCVKSFADDLAIIPQLEHDHASVPRILSKKCSDIDLEICPDKCVSVVYNGSKVKKNCSFPIGVGYTRNLSSDVACSLGHTLVHSLSVQRKLSNVKITNYFLKNQ